MLIQNLHTAIVDGIMPGAQGHLADIPANRSLERAGLIRVVDGSASAPVPDATPDAMAALLSERDEARHQLELAKAANAEMAAKAAKYDALPLESAAAADLIAKLQAELAAANSLLEEKTKGSKGK